MLHYLIPLSANFLAGLNLFQYVNTGPTLFTSYLYLIFIS